MRIIVLLLPFLAWASSASPRYFLNCTYAQPLLNCSLAHTQLLSSHTDSFSFDLRLHSGSAPLLFGGSQPRLVALFKATGRRLRSITIASPQLTPFAHFHFDLDDPINTFTDAFDGDDTSPTQKDLDRLHHALQNQNQNALFSNSLTIVVTNETPSPFTLTSSSSSSMATWSPPQTLSTSSQTSFSLDFGSEIFSNGEGSAVYALGQIEAALTVSAKNLGVEFTFSPELNTGGYFTFPPPLTNSQPYRIELIDGATMSVVVVDCSARGVKQPLEESKAAFLSHWMGSLRPVIGDLPFNLFYLPGTHDSGTWAMADKLIEYWSQDQTIDITQQLEHGTRVIDVRSGDLGPQPNVEDQFIFIHGDFKSEIREWDGLLMVRDFVDAHPDEIVVVDIHSMSRFGDGEYDFEAQRDLVLSAFQTQKGSYLIGPEHYGKTMNEMFAELEPTQRVIVAWNSDKFNQTSSFWPALNQCWDGNSISSVSKVEQFLTELFAWELPDDMLWSAQAEIWTLLHGPTYLSPHLENWFYCESDWAQLGHIVNVDFVHETYIPQLTVACTLLRGTQSVRGSGLVTKQ